ncbi:MAG: serine/threonine-protein kinase [Dokdonella sp.]
MQQDLDSLRILREALDAGPGERDDFVSLRCGDDLALRDRVVSLLRGVDAQEQGNDGADLSENGSPQDADILDTDRLIDTKLGCFRIVERIGRGGMGVVYLADREDADFDQKVAIKLIRRGFDFDDIRTRFLRERRILAGLSHPNLARFIDGGIANDGRPWFALEYVDGETMTRFCDQRKLDIRARIRLFLHVCAAVQYAHTQLIVHRDLKPGNVLVDASGTVRLLDFGIAKLVDGDSDALSTQTMAGAHAALTPEYAAPEQLTGGDVGIAADIYSLGVIAYELVSGVLPRVIDRRDLVAAARDVREVPTQPLTQAITRGERVALRLAARSTTVRGYRAYVRGDLARIVDKTLLDEPRRRYATVQAFADDLVRWLDGMPVHASGHPFGYRLRKFVMRNRVAVGLGTLLVMCVVAATVGMGWQLHETKRQAAAALQMKDHAVELIAQLDSEETGAAPPTLLHLVEESVAQLEHLQPGSPLRRELAADAARMLKRVSRPEHALQIVERELGPDPGRGARTDAARLRQTAAWAEALLYWDRPDEAWAYLARTTAHPGDVPPMLLADALSIQAEVENSTGRFASAVASARRVLAIFRQSLPDSDARIADARLALAAGLVGMRENAAGRAETERVLVDLPVADSKVRRFALTKAAMRRSLFGDFEAAETAYADGAAMDKRMTSFAPHRFDEAMRAVNLFDMGELDRARALIEPIHRANDTPGSSDTWEAWSTDWIIGEIALAESRNADAAASFGRAATAARQQGASFADFALYNESLEAVALTLDGQLETSLNTLDAADLRVAARPNYATTMRAVAHAVWLDRSGRFADAVREADGAITEMNNAYQSPLGLREQLMEHRDTVRIRIWQAQALRDAGEPVRALAVIAQARAIGAKTLGPAHPFMRALEASDHTLPATVRSQRPAPPSRASDASAKSAESHPDAR